MKTETFRFDDDGDIPNSRYPLILYHHAVDPASRPLAEAFEELFEANGWGNGWRDSVFPFHHYHSNTHEVLGIAAGTVTLRMGGEDGVTMVASAGDALLIPAGVGHRRVSPDAGLLVIGAYPPGPACDLKRQGEQDLTAIRTRIAHIPVPSTDPVGGVDGPVKGLWQV